MQSLLGARLPPRQAIRFLRLRIRQLCSPAQSSPWRQVARATDDKRRLEAAPVPGGSVPLLYRNKRFKPKLRHYRPGTPAEFAEFLDPWDNFSNSLHRPRFEPFPMCHLVANVPCPMRGDERALIAAAGFRNAQGEPFVR